MELNKIYNCDCRDGLRQLDSNSVDLTVTSPPYDSLRTYQDDEFAWNFEIFKEVADELYRVTKPGGVVVWVVGDEVVNGSETGTSFRQALYFKEIGFKIHDTMVYEKNSSTFPARINSKRYSQIFEYMFVFVKGKIRDDIKLIADKRNKWAGWTNWGTKTQYDKEGNLIQQKINNKPTPEFSLRTNIWKYTVSFNDKTGHPAVFPEKLAEDHILSWTNEGDVVLDPFMGSGTTAKMAMMNKRNYIGFEKNTEYYEVSLKRVGKYEDKLNDAVTEVAVNDAEGNSGTLQFNTVNDNEEEGKTEIFNEIVGQLNEYLNDMSLSILKTLKLTFVSKANDKRVEQVLKERGLYSGETVEKKQYVAPSVTVSEDPERKYIENKEREAAIEEDRAKVSPDQFVKNFVTILPSGVTMRDDYKAVATEVFEEANKIAQSGTEQASYIPAPEVHDDTTLYEAESTIPVEEPKEEPKEEEDKGRLNIDVKYITETKEFSDAVTKEVHKILSDPVFLNSVASVCGKPEITVNEELLYDEPMVIDLNTMDPIPAEEPKKGILPDELNEAVRSGEANKIVEVQPKRGRGRPKGSKDKVKRKPKGYAQTEQE